MPPRAQAKEKRPAADLSNLIFSEGEVGKLQKERYMKFYERSVTPTRYADESCLCRLGLLNNVQWILDRLDLAHFCSLNDATYENLTLEYLSMFTYYTPMVDQYSSGMVRFRMFNRDYELRQDTLGDMLHFPHGNGATPFCIGGQVTSIARALGLSNKLATLQPLLTPSLDIDSCRVQRLIKDMRDDIYSVMDMTAPEPDHPASSDIPVQDNQGGKTDDEYDEMEHDDPTFSDPTTRAHTLPVPSNTFADTSP
ncbi:hypothetical protein KIW84_020823 [Lathyrus oleraceus]|uniref:Arabidopsis retrotransposon Orf1 C-terminal domain-containing protein n=1 Tax=Pisum sativum TaxID=3888 RepID=A0A9D5B7U9_PEA|nr:hypothetical protein KIW84_020823 [Pisum sativum]